jgi:hypothetical protein
MAGNSQDIYYLHLRKYSNGTWREYPGQIAGEEEMRCALSIVCIIHISHVWKEYAWMAALSLAGSHGSDETHQPTPGPSGAYRETTTSMMTIIVGWLARSVGLVGC